MIPVCAAAARNTKSAAAAESALTLFHEHAQELASRFPLMVVGQT